MSLPRALARNASRLTRLHPRTLHAPQHPRVVLQHAARPGRPAAFQLSAFSTSAAGSAPTQTGFSYPGPRKLSEIVKLQLLTKHGTPRVQEIWQEYHQDHQSAIGDTLSAEEYGLLRQRTSRCRHFVLPVPR